MAATVSLLPLPATEPAITDGEIARMASVLDARGLTVPPAHLLPPEDRDVWQRVRAMQQSRGAP